ncbi:hypothetical protein M514_11941 [Trichuris suis]|uniref:RNA polymerase II-associated protein 3 n=1 Tax=Trichuris suis TaxID=68888 RepID=A0A085NTK0_9BILA|nr:hypothetical protein M514_11941 [Trichuris suis]
MHFALTTAEMAAVQTVREKDAEKSLSERQLGNAQYGKKEYAKAVMHYSRAIQANPSDPLSYCNRAMALLKLARYEEASKDCCAAISIDCKYVKAYFRRGLAFKELGRHREAVDDFQTVLLLEPENHLAVEELRKLSKGELVTCTSVESLLARCKIDEKEFDEPLRQIPVRYATEPESTNHIGNEAKRTEIPKPEVVQEPSLDSGPAEICPVPSNIRQMLVDWKTLRNDSRSLCNYILNIPLSRFQTLFDNFLSISELSDLLKAFQKALGDEVKLRDCVKRLVALTTTKRFGSASVFLSKRDVENLKIILNRASTSEELKNDCSVLTERFHVDDSDVSFFAFIATGSLIFKRRGWFNCIFVQRDRTFLWSAILLVLLPPCDPHFAYLSVTDSRSTAALHFCSISLLIAPSSHSLFSVALGDSLIKHRVEPILSFLNTSRLSTIVQGFSHPVRRAAIDGDGDQRSIVHIFPERVVEMRRHRWRTLRIRYSSGSSGSTSAHYGGSGGGTRSYKQWRCQHQCCCCCCCPCHHNHHSGDILNAGTMFMKKGGKKMSKSDASVTVLLWLLLVLQFVVNCIRFFSTQYKLTNVAEKNSLFSLLNNHYGQSKKIRRRKRSKTTRNEKISKLTETSDENTSGVQSILSSAYPSPVPVVSEDYKEKIVSDVKLKKLDILSVPSHLEALYTSPGTARVAETNFITCIFEATGSKVLEVVSDFTNELEYWRNRYNLVTICCEMTWSVPASERHVPSELSIQQAVLKHMEKNQRRVDAMTMALYHAKGQIKSLPCRPFVPIVQQNCHSKNGATLGCYRRVYPSLLPLAHKDASDAHEPFWALRMTDIPLVPVANKGPQRSVFTMNLICVTLESCDGLYL